MRRMRMDLPYSTWSLSDWKKEGRIHGREVAERDWDDFRYNLNPTEVGWTKAAVDKKMNDTFLWEHGRNIWDAINKESVKITPQLEKTWGAAFKKSYEKTIKKSLDRLIPKAIRSRLREFCELVAAVRSGVESSDEPAAHSYGVHLGSIITAVSEALITQAEVPKIARRDGKASARDDWARVMEGEPANIIRWTAFERDTQGSHYAFRYHLINTPGYQLFTDIWSRAYKKEMEKKLRQFMPPRATKNARMICAYWSYVEELRTMDPRAKVAGVRA